MLIVGTSVSETRTEVCDGDCAPTIVLDDTWSDWLSAEHAPTDSLQRTLLIINPDT